MTAHLRSVYVVGAMTGVPYWNRDAFLEAERDLVERGFEVDHPHRVDAAAGLGAPPADGAPTTPALYRQAIRRSLHAMLDPATWAVVALPGWPASTGASLEVAAAARLGMPVLAYPHLDPLRIVPADTRSDDDRILDEEAVQSFKSAIVQANKRIVELLPNVAEDHDKEVVPAGVAANVAAVLTNTLQMYQRRPGEPQPNLFQVIGLELKA